MTLWDRLKEIARQMVREPRDAAMALARLDLPRNAVMMAYLTVMAVSVIVTEPMLVVAAQFFQGAIPPPLFRAVGSSIGGLALVWVMWKMAAMMGGRAGFDQVLANFVLLESLFLGGIAALLVVMVLLPALAGLIGIGFIVYWLWLFAQSFAGLQGFPSAWKALGIVIVSWIIVNYLSGLVMGPLSGLFGGATNV